MVGSLARTYTNTYLAGTNYTSRYILNRLLASTVTDGTNTATLVSNTYDQYTLANIAAPCTGGGGLCEHDNTNYPYTFTYRGLVNISTTPASTATTNYDMTGNVTSATMNGVTTSIVPANNYAMPGQVTTNTLTSTMTWNGFDGMTSAAGPNGDTESISYDTNARPHTTTSPYGAVTTYTYNDGASPPNKIATTCPTGGTCTGATVKTSMDGFGRTIKTVSSDGTTTFSTVDVQYAPCGCSPLGKLSLESRPYAPGDTEVWTTNTYDASGRTLSVALPDGSTTSYQYKGNVVTVTDPASKWKTFTTDAFGNLVSVLETDPNPILGNVTTTYTYDVLNHLTQVSMPRGGNTQTRTFNYNIGTPATTVTAFLRTAINPENGTVTYGYNANNLLSSKTDAKGQQLTYQYDSYNRLTSVTWANASPSSQVLRTYYYDTNPLDSTGFSQNTAGRLAAVKYASLIPSTGPNQLLQPVEMYNYTQAGLTAAKRLQMNEWYFYTLSGVGHNTTLTSNLDSSFTYNPEGEMISMTYPSTVSGVTSTTGASYNYSYDTMYRLSGMTTSSTTVVNNVAYNAANQLLSINYGGGGFAETRSYNTLGQLANLKVKNTGLLTTVENLTYNYPTASNNGKLSSVSDAVSGETVTYTYDSLNRLLTANGSGWGEQYAFDGFGNLTTKQVTSGSGPTMTLSVNWANNQIQGVSGITYDANGNTTLIPNGTTNFALNYDVENRQISAVQTGTNLVNYGYDTQNRRIWSWAGALDTYGNATNYSTNIYTPDGRKLAAYTLAPALVYSGGSYVPTMQVTLTSSDQYFGGRRLALMDQLGSAGNNSSQYGSYYPWGEPKGTTNPQDAWSYATYWQDSFTNLNYANNRYHSSAYGRFMTPDPYTNSGRSDDPQSWNRYAYVSGDPVNNHDPGGLFARPAQPEEGTYGNNSCGDGWIFDASLSGPCGNNTCFAVDGFTQSPSPSCALASRGGAPSPPPLAKACKGTNGAGKAGTLYFCLHQSGNDWNELGSDLKSLKKALAKDPNCDKLLTSGDLSMSDINDVLSDPSRYFTLANLISAPNGNRLSGTTNDLIGPASMVLQAGLFSGTNTFQAELTILHEMAHYAGVFGPENVSGNPTSDQNDQTVTKDCSKTLLGN